MKQPPPWPPILPPDTLVWCEDCGKQPAMIAENNGASVDLLCACRSIIAVLSRAD